MIVTPSSLSASAERAVIIRERWRHAPPEHLSEQANARLDVAGEAAGGDGQAVAREVGSKVLTSRDVENTQAKNGSRGYVA